MSEARRSGCGAPLVVAAVVALCHPRPDLCQEATRLAHSVAIPSTTASAMGRRATPLCLSSVPRLVHVLEVAESHRGTARYDDYSPSALRLSSWLLDFFCRTWDSRARDVPQASP